MISKLSNQHKYQIMFNGIFHCMTSLEKVWEEPFNLFWDILVPDRKCISRSKSYIIKYVILLGI